MSIQLNEIEARLQNLIEVHLAKYIPKPGTQERIAQLIANALRANISTRGLGKTDNTVPTEFLLVVHPSKLEQWEKEPRLLEGLSKVIRLVASEMGLKFTAAPSISLISDASIGVDSQDVRISRPENLAETQNMSSNAEDTPVRAAFLIVGGTNVFTLNQSVTNIGRRMDNNLVVDDPRVSRYHAQIRYVRNRFLIFDLNSTGGTFVNGQRTTQSVLYPGDVISLAGLPLVFGQDNPPSAPARGNTSPLSPASSDRATLSVKGPLLKNDKPS